MLNQQNLQSAIKKGKTQWLQDYLAENLPSLFLPDANYQAWFDDFIQTLESKQLSKPSQQKNYLTNVRNAIKVIDPDHPALGVIKFSRETWIEINQTDRDRIAERTTKLIENPNAIVSKAIELVKTNNWSNIAAGLAVLTGRRCGEIIKTAQFEFKTKYSVTFRGALKRKDEAVELVFEIPVLCRADLVIEAIDSLRLQLGDEVLTLSTTQINQRYEERVAQKCERHFLALVPLRSGKDNLYSHLFRAIYATIACYWYCPPTVPEMEYRAAIQGHYQVLKGKDDKLRRSLAAGRHYFDYKIADDSGNIDGRLGIKLGLPGVRVIEQFQPSARLAHGRKTRPSFPAKTHSSSLHTTKVKSPSQLKSIMNQQSKDKLNSSSEAVVSLKLPLARLESISRLLNFSQTETIYTLVDWAEAAAALAQDLEIDEPLTPEALTAHVRELKQNYSARKLQPSEPISNDRNNSNFNSSSDQALIIIEKLTTSLNDLTEAWVSRKSDTTERAVNNSRQHSRVNGLSPLEPSAKTSNLGNPNSQTDNEDLVNKNNQQKISRISVANRQRDTPEVLVEDINRAIDALIEFNNSPNRPHRQKFRLSIKPIADLTGRATNSISRVLKERSEEIESHHQQHQIDSYHNKSRRDDEGHDYPTVESEPEIDYHKFTQITPAD